MSMKRTVVFLFLVLASVLSLPVAQSQTYSETTLTTINTSTRVRTITSLTVTQTTTEQVTSSNHVSYSFTLEPAALACDPTYSNCPDISFSNCYYFDLGGFPVASGNQVSGTISVSTSSTFYIMTVENLNLWTASGQCYPSDYELMSPVDASSAYSFTWTPQTSTTYSFLIVSYAPGVSGSFEADSSQFHQLTTSTSFVFYTSVETSVNYLTMTKSFWMQLTGEAKNGTSNPYQVYWSLSAVLGLLILALFTIRRRQHRRQK